MFKIYDLEVLRDFFLYVDVEISKDEYAVFEISKFKNDLIPLIDYLKTLGGQIGFNNLNYDAQIQQFVLNNYEDWLELNGEQVAILIFQYSQKVIDRSRQNKVAGSKTIWPDFQEKHLQVRQLDLLKVWHYDNLARSCSLKWLEYSMDWENIEDMPIDYRDSIDDRTKADLIIEYCKNDCLATRVFYEITLGKTDNNLYKGINKVQLRKDIEKEFGFKCLNFSDVKIGDQINKVNYAKAKQIEVKDVKREPGLVPGFTFGDCFPEYSFKTVEFNNLLEKMKDIRVMLHEDQDFKFVVQGTTFTFGRGGMHSVDKPRLVRPIHNEILRDADVGSMYPNFIRKKRLFPRHLGEAWLEGYSDIINKRLEAKTAFKKTGDPKYKSLDEAFKLALNGGSFGKTGEPTSWQYDPLVNMKITIGCQIELLMFIEELVVNKIKIISANTDGVVVLMTRDQEDTYNRICKEWEIKVGNDVMGKLEYADYKLLAQLSINHYTAIKTDDTPKHKGSFMVDYELHKNKSFKVIPLALEAYYSHGLNPGSFIRNHINILDFCAGIRAKGDWYFELRSIKNGSYNVEKQQKTLRMFVSNTGSKLIKRHQDGREIQQNAGKWMCTLLNKYEKRNMEEYDINYDFYIEKVYNIVRKIEPHVVNEHLTQLALF